MGIMLDAKKILQVPIVIYLEVAKQLLGETKICENCNYNCISVSCI